MTVQRDLGPYAAQLARSWSARFGADRCRSLDGTLLKADVSGFTRLSERLARTERTGAEEVNDVINGLWTELISPVLEAGGDVLQFGGDALAVWFEGDSHGLRAATAAVAMHRAVRDRPAVDTPAGRVRLRMSAGAESGRFGIGIVGATHQELVVLGPASTSALQCEARAAAGQTALGPQLTATVLAAGGRVTPLPGGPGSLLRRVPTAPFTDPDRWPLSDGGDFLDPQVRSLEQAGLPLGEHRRVCVSFLHLGGLDAVTTARGSLAAHGQVSEVARHVEAQCAAHSACWLATDLATDGVVFLLVSGAPQASEDDEERMLRVVRAVADACTDVPLRVGVHAGRGFAGDVGHPLRRSFAVLGDTTNTAARLMASAEPGQIRLSSAVYDRSARDHSVTWIGDLALKGRRQPLAAGALGPRVTADRGALRDLPLVGREAQQQALEVALRDLATGRGRSFLLLGPRGVGKSRLADELTDAATHAGITCLIARAESYESARPYGVLIQGLREVLGLVAGEEEQQVGRLCGAQAALAPLLNLPLGIALPPTEESAAVDAAFIASQRTELLADVLLRSTRSLVVLAEDVHLLDRSSLELLDALAARTDAAPLVLLCSGRSLPQGWPRDAGSWDQIELEPLEPAAARALVLAAAGDLPLEDLHIDRVLAEAEGNPLFLRELVLWAAGSDSDDVPEGVEQVIAVRIDALAPESRAVLRQASVLGALVEPDLAAAVLDDARLQRPASWRALQDFLQPEQGGYRFRHDLYRRVAYQGLSVRRRRAIHLATAEILGARRSSDPGTLAQHLYAAQRWQPAFTQGWAAARAAQESGALADAFSLAQTALDAGRRAGAPAPELAAVDDLLGDVADLLGRYSVADQAYLRAGRAGELQQTCSRAVKRAAVVERQGRYRFALSLLSSVERSQPEVRLLRAALLRRSSTLFRCGRLVESRTAAQRVVELAADDPLDRARALLRLEMIASELADATRFELGAAAQVAFQGLDEPRELGNLHLNLGVTACESDDWALALRHYDESAASYRRAGDRVGAAFAVNNAAEILVDQGRLEQAREGFAEAKRVFRAAGHLLGAVATDSALGRVLARTGDVAEAESLLLAVHARFVGLGAAALAADAQVRLVEVALLRADPAALPMATAAVRQVDEVDGGVVLALSAHRYTGVAEALAGRRAQALATLRSALASARTIGFLHEIGSALDHLDALGALGDQERAERDTAWARLGVVSAPGYGLAT